MQENLVIVESPAKAKTIEKFLGKSYKVMSSYGHIRDLKKSGISMDKNTLTPIYEVPADKTHLVAELRSAAAKAKKIWLASDEDREGEAISWHLCEVLGLDESNTSRIVFHEITKSAILEAIDNPRTIDMNLVNAQQARRVLDRIVGFKLSPVLWRKVKPSLSAGRVQSVAVRLIVERERAIQQFVPESFYRVQAVFSVPQPDGSVQELKAELDRRFDSRQEATAFLESCKGARFTVSNVSNKPMKRTPAPPFTTSTLQQEAARKLGMPVGKTMMVAQRLYESGQITYMRTDSVNLSRLCLGSSKAEVENLYGPDYSHTRNYHTSTRGAQEAHEAIRPVYMNQHTITGTAQERRLYELIWKRTIASQMEDAQIEKTTVTIGIEGHEATFVATGEVVVFDGFLKVYRESLDDEAEGEEASTLPTLFAGDELKQKKITSTERLTQCQPRYTEASLVHKMEELGIGRPSTYAPTISTIQQRQYVSKTDKKGTEHEYTVDVLRNGKITTTVKKETVGGEKRKLSPTDIGIVVNDFLIENFPTVMEYNFTADVEKQFDLIAEGKEEWTAMIRDFDNDFSPAVDSVANAHEGHKVGERQLGTDPATGRRVTVKIGRFGPVAQIGTADDDEKPRFAQIPKDKSIETLTLAEALELFKLPRTVGTYLDQEVTANTGRYGAYVHHNGQFYSLPKDEDPFTVTLDTAIRVIEERQKEEKNRFMKVFAEEPDMQVIDGRYGPYISYKGKNYKLPRNLAANLAELTYEQCQKVVTAPATPKTKRTKK